MQSTVPPLPISRTAVALIAAAGLAYEMLLLRLFAIAQWHHFAFLAISLALLGFGVAGTVLALAGNATRGRERTLFASACVGFALTAPAGWAMAQRLPVNALEIYWDPTQPLWLAGQYLLLLPAFFFVGAAVCLAFQAQPAHSARTYGADLAGAGAGAAGLVVALFWLDPTACLRLVAIAGALASVLTSGWRAHWAGVVAITVFAVLVAPDAWLAPQPSQYKGRSQQLNAPGAAIIDTRSSPLGRLDLVESPQVPIRYAPGMSLTSPHTPPEQLALFTDAGNKSVILPAGGEPPRYLNWLTSALPYALHERPQTLVLGAGGGADLWQAKLNDAASITAVELNPQVVSLVRKHGGDILDGVDMHIADARRFARRGSTRYDVVQLARVGGAVPAAAGVNSLAESHVHTVEAYGQYLDRLKPGGVLAITHWVQAPPRAAVKSFTTTIEALEDRGVSDPGNHLAMIRSWKTSTLLVTPTPWSNADIEAIRSFARERSFDLVHLPGMQASEANRHNRLDRPRFYRATQALLGPDREAFLDGYPFHVRPATDDRPYFFRFFQWDLLPDLFRQRATGGLSQIDAGYPILVFALVQAILFSVALILLPLIGRAEALRRTPVKRGRLLGLCLAVGLGFLLIEIAFIQRFMLVLGHPVYAVAVVLSGFLVFAGAGSAAAQRLGDDIGRPVLGIAVLAATYIALLPIIEAPLATQNALPRVGACLALIAPLAFCMGMPFARALRRLGDRDPAIIPWAWAVNGVASVAAAMLATLLAVHLGFTAVIVIAIGLYGVAWSCYRF